MALLIDTSVWIDLLGKARRHRLSPEDLEAAVTCPPILQEILQGIGNDEVRPLVKTRFLALHRVADPVKLDLYLSAADLYSTALRRGLTIRSSIDCLIAAIAIEHDLTVWHADRDFSALAKFTSLKEKTGPLR